VDRLRQMAIASVFLAAAGAAWAQDKTVAAPAFDADACAKHCQGMAADHQKMRDSRRAMEEKTASAWKEIRAAVDEAKKSRGEKKVAALESALDRLVSFHETMMAGTGIGGMHAGMGMAGCGEMTGEGRMRHGSADCCADMRARADCCAHPGSEKPGDCPMIKGI